MTKVVTAICMLVVLVESAPVFAAKHEIDQAAIKADGGFPYKITRSGSYKLTVILLFQPAWMASTFFPRMSLSI
jgi:hypothetical protein